MEWSSEAEVKIHKAPFFIRNFARKKAEEVAKLKGKRLVELEDVEMAKKNREVADISNIDLSVKGCLKGCSQTQIKDIGSIGYIKPKANKGFCVGCLQCVKAYPTNNKNI